MLIIACKVYAGGAALSGKLTDGKEALPGVSVWIDTLKTGTATDLEGWFLLDRLPPGKYTVVFSYLGFDDLRVIVSLPANGELDMGTLVLKENTQTLDEVTVTSGFKQGTDAKAVNIIRTSPMAVNVLSADMIKKLPDKNAAEALKRMSSTNVQTNKGEGSYVSFRGTPNEWTSTLLNGNRLPVADEENTSRSFDYEVLPSDMIDMLVVARTLTPEMEGDNIGGSVDLLSKSAVDQRTISLNVGAGYNTLAQKPVYNLDFTYGDRTRNGKFGFIMNTAYYGRNYAAHAQKVIYGYNTNHGIASYHLKNYSGLRNTVGINTGFEYNPNSKISIEGRFLYSTLIDDKYQKKELFNYSVGQGSRVQLQNIHGKLLRRLVGGELSAEFRITSRLKLKVNVTSYSSTFRYGNVPFGQNDPQSGSNGYYYVEFASPLVAFRDVACVDYFGNPVDCNDPARVETKLLESDNPYGTGDNHESIIPQVRYYDIFTGDSILRTDQFTFFRAYSELNDTRERDPVTARLDLSYQVNNKISLQWGLKARIKSGERNIGLTTWEQDVSGKRPESYSLAEFETAPFAGENGFLKEYGNPYTQYDYPFLTRDQLAAFQGRIGDTLRTYKMDKFNNEYFYWVGNSYSYRENIYAGYAMFHATPVPRLRIIGGLRLEYTWNEMRADTLTDRTDSYLDIIGNDTIIKYYNIPEERVASNKYLSVLPSLNLTFSPNAGSNIRFAVSRSMHRPNFNEMKPGDFVFKLEEQEITYGNPQLKPTYAWNFDLIYEYFWGNKGVLSAGIYYKYIQDHIFAYSASGNQTYSGIVIRKFDNVNKAQVFGIEALIERNFDFLPGGWGGLGAGVNITYTYSRMQVPGREQKQSMTEQTPWLVNVKLLYEKYGFSTSLSFNYTGRYLHELNLYQVRLSNGTVLQQQDTDYDIFHDKMMTLDFQAGYAFKKHFSVYLQLNNLLNQPHRMYRGQPFRTYYTEFYRLRGQIGFKYNY